MRAESPPEFTSSEPERIGAATHAVLRHARLDPDSGRAGVDYLAKHLFAFKVPTLQNVAVTTPHTARPHRYDVATGSAGKPMQPKTIAAR